MFDREKFKKEIKVQLKNVPKDRCAAFAVRSAMRILPLLATEKEQNHNPFWFWNTKDGSVNKEGVKVSV